MKGSIVENCYNDSVVVRHGAIYGISEILCGLSGNGHLHNMKDDTKDSVFLKMLSKNE